MSKATLAFSLPEERVEYACALHGAEWKSIVYGLDSFLRDALKYGHAYKTADEALRDVRDALIAFCKDSNLDPWSD